MKNENLLALQNILEDDPAVAAVNIMVDRIGRDQIIVIHFKDGTTETLNCCGYRDTYVLFKIGRIFHLKGEFA